jgi:hypothetical protein
MLTGGMAKTPERPSPVAAKRPPGRPPKPGGRLPQVEVQRAYRARLAAAGKVVRIVDALAVDPVAPHVTASIPDFDPATQMVCDRATFVDMRDRLHNALANIENLERDRNRWQTDCARAEAELREERQLHTNTIKDKIVLQQEIAPLKAKPRRMKT